MYERSRESVSSNKCVHERASCWSRAGATEKHRLTSCVFVALKPRTQWDSYNGTVEKKKKSEKRERVCNICWSMRQQLPVHFTERLLQLKCICFLFFCLYESDVCDPLPMTDQLHQWWPMSTFSTQRKEREKRAKINKSKANLMTDRVIKLTWIQLTLLNSSVW